MTSEDVLTIAYYNLRGKAQVPRLLCEYLGVQYQNKFYTVAQYAKEMKTSKDKSFNLPYLSHKGIHLYGSEDMCFYIITFKGREEMLGKNQQDKIRIKMYCWSIQTFAEIIAKNFTNQFSQSQLNKQWKQFIQPKLKKYETACSKQGDWLMGYISIIDFSIYELWRYMDLIYPGKMKAFSNLTKIKLNIQRLPEIKVYQNSKECVKQISPKKILQEVCKIIKK